MRVVGNVSIKNGATLTIVPGARVEFQDYFRLDVAGTLIAVGTPTQRILFTTDEPALFTVDQSHAGCWHGIGFDHTPSTNTPSLLAYCIFEYSKATGSGSGLYPYAGGVLSIVDYSDITVENCILRHNVADYAPAVLCYRNANPLLVGNLLHDNHALQNASAVYIAYSYPRLINNTIVRNPIHNEDNPYIESCAIRNFLGRPVLAGNIILDNLPDVFYQHFEVWYARDYHTHDNNIAGTTFLTDNIDADPRFVSPAGVDGIPGTWDDNFRLLHASPSIDTASNESLPPSLTTDLDGAARIFDGDLDGTPIADMGAYESGDCNANGLPDVDEIAAGLASDCNANRIPDECEIDAFGTSLDCNADDVPDECETIAAGDFTADGLVTAADFTFLAASLAGPDHPPLVPDGRCTAAHLAAFDADGDGDIDLADYAALARLTMP